MKRKKYDRVGKRVYMRTKAGKKHPIVRNHEQIERGFKIAHKWRNEK